MPSLSRIPVIFYRVPAGSEPVREWLKALGKEDRRQIGADLARVQEQWPIGMPVCRALGKGLWEVRSALTGNRIARVLFCFSGSQAVLLHAFIKKARKTPVDEMALARRRMKDQLA